MALRARNLEASVERRADGCWIWTGRIDPNGYGKVGDKWAHRAMYELMVGPIPAGLTIDHLCRVTACVNPTHLEAVTRAENIRRAVDAIRSDQCPSGHEFTAANTYRTKRGHRACRACHRQKVAAAYRRKREDHVCGLGVPS